MKASNIKAGMVVYDKSQEAFARVYVAPVKPRFEATVDYVRNRLGPLCAETRKTTTHVSYLRLLTAREKGTL